MSLTQRLRGLFRSSTLSGAERERAARLGVYLIECEGYDVKERGMFSRTMGVYLNADEAGDHMRNPPSGPGWEDVECKRWGPRSLLGLFDGHALDLHEAKVLLARAAAGEPHEILPEPLTTAEKRLAEAAQVYLIWYEDKFHYGMKRDSFAISICLSREEAEFEYKSKGRQPAPSGGDGYEIVGPGPLSGHPTEVVREVLRRLQAGEPGPVSIPAKYY